jgi:hypothetical protein
LRKELFLRQFRINKLQGVPDSVKIVGLFVRDGDPQLFFDGIDEFVGVEAVRAQIVAERGAGGDLALVDFQASSFWQTVRSYPFSFSSVVWVLDIFLSQFFRLENLFSAIKPAFHAHMMHEHAVPAIGTFNQGWHRHFHILRPTPACPRF